MKYKNDQKRTRIGEDGELEEYYDEGVDAKKLLFWPTIFFVSVFTGVFFFCVGFTFGGIAINSIYDKSTDPVIKNIVAGCAITYNISKTEPVRTDLFSSYYSSSNVTDTILGCMNAAKIEAYSESDKKSLSSQTVRLSMIGCLGNEVSSSWFEYTGSNDSQSPYGMLDCLEDNHIYFRVITQGSDT